MFAIFAKAAPGILSQVVTAAGVGSLAAVSLLSGVGVIVGCVAAAGAVGSVVQKVRQQLKDGEDVVVTTVKSKAA